MSKISDVQRVLEEQQAVIKKIKEGLMAQIEALPDNPRINRVNANCFTMSSRDLGTNWTPEYHDFKRQYRVLCEVVDRVAPDKLIETLQAIIEEGKTRGTGDDRGRTIQFHPEVIENLRNLLL